MRRCSGAYGRTCFNATAAVLCDDCHTLLRTRRPGAYRLTAVAWAMLPPRLRAPTVPEDERFGPGAVRVPFRGDVS
ncbi:MAG: hypothetical protein MUE82_12635 [Chloroflexi bacterium]|jgi:hypothetical protein|nr:hypothetical protein [Chloroflexota bacterium]